MTKDTKRALVETLSLFEWLPGVDTLFVYVVMPVLCIIVMYFLGAALFQLILDGHPASTSAASDLLSIDPDKWFPRA